MFRVTITPIIRSIIAVSATSGISRLHCNLQEYIFDADVNIQGVSGGICITLGNDSMSDSKQKSSYEHGSDFERLRSYGHFLIPVHALM